MVQEGYIFLDETAAYKVGDMVAHDPEKGRWTCVDHQVHKVILTKWPGQLYKVKVIDFVSNDAEPKLVNNPGYTRALSYRIEAVMDRASLFGAYGSKICEILDWIETATYEQMVHVGEHIHPKASAIYSRVWHTWLKAIDLEAWQNWYQYLDHDTVDFDICSDNVLAWPTQRENPDSPINKGLLLICQLVDDKAKNLEGDKAWVTLEKEYEDDEEEQCLTPVWSKARSALLYTAMGFGAKPYLSESEASCLTYAWQQL